MAKNPLAGMTSSEFVKDQKQPTLHIYYDENGDYIGSGQLDPTTDLSAMKGKTIYKTDSGSWTIRDETKNVGYAANISLDKKAKTINIEAPKSFFESEYYKQQVKPTLESYARAYKADPNAKYPVSSDAGADEHDIEWYVNEVNKDLQDLVNVELLRVEKSSEAGHELSYDNLKTMNTSAVTYKDASGEEHKVSDTDRQVIPNIPEADFLKRQFGSAFDEVTNSVDHKTLMEKGWNRERQSDKDIIALKEAVDAYFERGDLSDTELYSQMYAFRNFMNQTAPKTGFFRSWADFSSNVGYAALTGAATFWVNVLNVTEGLFNAVGRAAGGENYKKREQTFISDYLKPEFDAFKKQHVSRTQQLNRGAAAAYSITDTVTPMVIQMVVGRGLTKALADGITSVASARAAKLAKEAMEAKDFAERTVAQVYLGTDLLVNGMNTTQAASALVMSLQNLNTIQQAVSTGGIVAQNATIILRGAKVTVWAAELAADAVIDAALGRPDVVRKILDGDDDADKYLLLKELGTNAAFWLGARTTGKITKAVKQTKLGRTTTAIVAPRVSGISTKISKTGDKIKGWVFGEDWKENLLKKRTKLLQSPGNNAKKVNKLTKKINTLASRDTTRKQQEILSKMRVFTGESDDIMENVAAIEKQMKNVKVAQLLWDDSNLRRAAGNWFNTFVNSDFDPEFKGAFDQYINQLSSVINAENAIGFGEDLLTNKSLADISDKGIRILDQRTSNYIGAKIQLSYGVERSEKTLKDLEEKVKVFQKAASPELIAATDELIESYRGVYAKFQALGTDPDFALNLYNNNELDELRNAKNAQGEFIFGNEGRLYGKTMRVSDLDEYGNYINRGAAKNQTNILSNSLDYDATGDFVDPTYVLTGEITEKSQVAAIQANAHSLTELPGVNTEVMIGGGATEQARLFKKTPNYGTAIKTQSKSVYENLSTSGTLNNFFEEVKDTSYGMPKTGLSAGSKTYADVDKVFDDYLEALGKTKAGKAMASNFELNKLGKQETQYMALLGLSNDSVEFLDGVESTARKEFKDMLKSKGLKESDIDKVADAMAKDIKEVFRDRLMLRLDDLSGELIENGSTIVDRDKVYNSITELMGEIEGAKKATDVVKLYDIQGRETFVKMDPLIADIFNTRPISQDMSGFQKVNNLWNRTFRLGTTGANLKSYMAQNVKDFGNAFIGGGADRTIKEVARHLTDELGENIVEQIEQFEPRIYQQLSDKAKATGESVAELAVQRELSIGRAISPAATESEAYKFMTENRAAKFGGKADYYTGAYDKISGKLDKVMDVLERPQEAREVWLRNMTYANAFSDTIESGGTIKDARISARFLMNNSTTNFGREMYHLNNLRNSVPYLGAAVNGTKSFWRVFSLDPVGVFGRLMGGIVFPVVYLTGQSLATEENKRIWQNIPEYQKDGNIIFISNGQIISIPMPEEIGSLVNPVRQFVEHLNGVDPKSFQELMLNDLIGLQPFNLDGFVMYDRNRLLGDPTIWDRIETGTSKFASQIMPPLVKSAVIYATGKDPYTGKEIPRDRKTIDPDTGEEIIMDYTTGSFAKWLSGLFGENLSAPMAQKLLQNLIGNAGVDIVNGVWGLGQQIVDGNWQGMIENPELLQNITEQAVAPFTIPSYSMANSQWTQAISQLNKRKTEILSGETYQNAIRGMEKAKTDDEYNKYKKIKQDLLDEYYQQVLEVSNNLAKQYPGAFDSSKYAAVIQLMNLETTTYGKRTGGAGENAYNDYLHSELTKSGKQAAISTMAELGFKSSSPTSIFGYYYEDENGDIITLWNDPVSIANMKNALSGADDIYQANIREILNENEINRYNMYDGYDKLDKKQKKQWKKDWNTKVVKALAPYVQKVGIDNLLSQRKVLDYLDEVIFVDNPWKTKDYLKQIFEGE